MYCLFFRLHRSPLALLVSFVDVLHYLPRAVRVPLESALNLVSRMSPCGAHAIHVAEADIFTLLCFKQTSLAQFFK